MAAKKKAARKVVRTAAGKGTGPRTRKFKNKKTGKMVQSYAPTRAEVIADNKFSAKMGGVKMTARAKQGRSSQG